MTDSISRRLEDLFPTDLSSIEKFHYFDGSDAYPNIIGCCLRLSDRIDKTLAEEAWALAKSRQPLCHVKIVDDQWVVRNLEELTPKTLASEFQFIEYESQPEPWHATIESVSDHAGPFLAVRQWPIKSEQNNAWRSEIWLWAHHCLADGAGSLSFINDWIRIYQNLRSDRDPMAGLKTIDCELLGSRNHLGLMEKKFIRHLPHQVVGIFGASKFVFRKISNPNSELSTRPDETPAKNFPCLHGVTLPVEIVRSIANEAKQLNVSQNAILMANVFQTVDRWRHRKSNRPVQSVLRMVLPINIRQWSDRRMPAANRASIVQIDRKTPSHSNVATLIQSIDDEIKVIKKWQLDKMFLILIRLISMFPNGLKKIAQNPKSRGYAVFTNLGRPFAAAEKAGLGKDLIPDSIDFFGPIRYGTPLNFAFANYGQDLRVTLHFDPMLVSMADAEFLLDDLGKSLGSLNEGQPNES